MFKAQHEKVIHVTIDVKHKPIVLKRHVEKINEAITKFGLTAIEVEISDNVRLDNIKDLKEKKRRKFQLKKIKVRKHQLFKGSVNIRC